MSFIFQRFFLETYSYHMSPCCSPNAGRIFQKSHRSSTNMKKIDCFPLKYCWNVSHKTGLYSSDQPIQYCQLRIHLSTCLSQTTNFNHFIFLRTFVSALIKLMKSGIDSISSSVMSMPMYCITLRNA